MSGIHGNGVTLLCYEMCRRVQHFRKDMISRANEIGSEGKKECSEEQTKAITGIVTGDCSGQRVQARHPCPREASLGGL